MSFIHVMEMLNFQQLFIQSSMSHDPSEIILTFWFVAQENVLIISNVANICAA